MLNVGIDHVEEQTINPSKRQKLDEGDIMEQILKDGSILSTLLGRGNSTFKALTFRLCCRSSFEHRKTD